MSKYFLWKVGSPIENNEMVELTKEELEFVLEEMSFVTKCEREKDKEIYYKLRKVLK